MPASQPTPAGTPTGSATTIRTRAFGEIEITDDQRITMPDGLIGFSECRSYAILPSGRDGFYWLQSLDHETLTLLLVDPFLYFDEYSVDLAEPLLQRLGATAPAEISVLAVVTLPGSSGVVTANLQGPVVFSLSARKGFQAVLADTSFGTREELPLERLAAVPA